jgi:hypothetical protein
MPRPPPADQFEATNCRWFEEDTFDKDFQEMLEQYQIDEVSGLLNPAHVGGPVCISDSLGNGRRRCLQSFLGESDGSQANADRPAVSMATSISLAGNERHQTVEVLTPSSWELLPPDLRICTGSWEGVKPDALFMFSSWLCC